jgi:DnaJ-class molecular chaperone
MSEEEYRCVLDEFFFRVYFQSYKENSLVFGNVPDPHLLERFGLPPYADAQDVKNRFRTLAKLYHPDHGGDAEKFIELMTLYEKITDL